MKKFQQGFMVAALIVGMISFSLQIYRESGLKKTEALQNIAESILKGKLTGSEFSEKIQYSENPLSNMDAFALATERDILEIAEERPLVGYLYDGKPAKYGNIDLVKAEKSLADIPRPWTVSKILVIYENETTKWMKKLQQRIEQGTGEMWPDAIKESERCKQLAILLGASRDPRAGLALGKSVELDNCIWSASAMISLHRYFLPDPRYKPIPPRDGPAAGNALPIWFAEVRRWLELNNPELMRAAESLSNLSESDRNPD